MPDKPNVKYIGALETRLSDLWGSAHSDWEVIDSYYSRTFPLWPEGVRRTEYHPSTPTNIIDHAVDVQMAMEARPHRPPAHTGETSQEYADLIERWLTAAFRQAALREIVLTWKQVSKHMVTYGYTVVEGPIWDVSGLPDELRRMRGEKAADWELRQAQYQAERRAWFPLRIRATHPARVLLDPTEKMPREAIKRVIQFAGHLHELSTKKNRRRQIEEVYPERDNYFDPVNTVEYWTRNYHAVLADGKLLWTDENTWGYIPFAHAFSGWGKEPTAVDQINPQNMAQGLLHPILPSLLNEAQRESGRHNALMEAVYQQRATTGDPAALADQINTSDILSLKPNEMWWVAAPQLPAWIEQAGGWVDQDIERGTYARTLSGLREPGVSTVGQQAILSTSANRKFAGPLKQLEHLATIVASNLLRLIDVSGETVEVEGIKLSAKEIQHDYSVEVTFQVIDPVLSLQERQLGLQELAAGVLSKETYFARANLEDASGERDRMAEDRIWQDPRVMELQAELIMKEMGIYEAVKALEAAKVQAAQVAQAAQGARGGSTNGQVLGPDGLPLNLTMGGAGGADAGNELRQPLTPDIAKPGEPGLLEGGI